MMSIRYLLLHLSIYMFIGSEGAVVTRSEEEGGSGLECLL
jgi:hypothetical protein